VKRGDELDGFGTGPPLRQVFDAVREEQPRQRPPSPRHQLVGWCRKAVGSRANILMRTCFREPAFGGQGLSLCEPSKIKSVLVLHLPSRTPSWLVPPPPRATNLSRSNGPRARMKSATVCEAPLSPKPRRVLETVEQQLLCFWETCVYKPTEDMSRSEGAAAEVRLRRTPPASRGDKLLRSVELK